MELVKHVTLDDMVLYSGPGNIHSDREVAKRTGLKDMVAQGMMPMAYASELLTRIHGDAWIERGQMSVKFVGLVYAGDTITVRADGDKIEAVNQRGEPVMVGDARLRG